MKLSEAILLGSTLRPQIRGQLFGDGRSCALGAAGEAIGAEPKDCPSSWEFIRRQWPWTQLFSFSCPACWRPRGACTALVLITHLNDFHGWSRQRTAAWVAAIEPREMKPQAINPREIEAGEKEAPIDLPDDESAGAMKN